MKYLTLLRGINVGGIKVPMAELRIILSELPVKNVKTFLQTGNVSLESQLTINELKLEIEHALSSRFKYNAHSLIFNFDTLANIIDSFPFIKNRESHAYVIFCNSQETVNELVSFKPLLSQSIEDVLPGKEVVYWQVVKGSTSDSRFARVIAKRKYQACTTNRNINTLIKISRISTA